MHELRSICLIAEVLETSEGFWQGEISDISERRKIFIGYTFCDIFRQSLKGRILVTGDEAVLRP